MQTENRFQKFNVLIELRREFILQFYIMIDYSFILSFSVIRERKFSATGYYFILYLYYHITYI